MKEGLTMKKNLMKKVGTFTLAMTLTMSTFAVTPVQAAPRKKVPATVKMKSISSKSYNKVTLKWKKAKNADKYVIYYKQLKAKKWKKLAVTKKLSFTHKSSKRKPLIAGKKYVYTVKGYNTKSKKYSKKFSKVLKVTVKKKRKQYTTEKKPDTNTTTETTTETKPETETTTEQKNDTNTTTETNKPTKHTHDYKWVEPVMATKEVPVMQWVSYEECNQCGALFLPENSATVESIEYHAATVGCGYGYAQFTRQEPVPNLTQTVEYEKISGYWKCSCGDTIQLECDGASYITEDNKIIRREHNYEYVPAQYGKKNVPCYDSIDYGVCNKCGKEFKCPFEFAELEDFSINDPFILHLQECQGNTTNPDIKFTAHQEPTGEYSEVIYEISEGYWKCKNCGDKVTYTPYQDKVEASPKHSSIALGIWDGKPITQ